VEGLIIGAVFLSCAGMVLCLYALLSGRCKHEWEVKEKHIEPSKLQKAKDGGFECKKSLSPYWVERSMIIILVCKKCGKIQTHKYEEL
jgi:hypothetical protein